MGVKLHTLYRRGDMSVVLISCFLSLNLVRCSCRSFLSLFPSRVHILPPARKQKRPVVAGVAAPSHRKALDRQARLNLGGCLCAEVLIGRGGRARRECSR